MAPRTALNFSDRKKRSFLSRQEVAKKWEDLTLANNFIFCKVMEENPDVAKELLELLLDIKIDRLERPQSEKQFKTDFVSRGIRFDVYVKDTA